MKVGIVTQPLYANYGGILQNYALQQILKKMGHEPITLDYMPSLSFGRYILYVGKGVLCSVFPSKRHPIKPYRPFLKRPYVIDSFVRTNIILSKTVAVYTKRLLKKSGIDALIVGSDQVWRYSYNSHHIEDMYLAFVRDYPCKKIAYGASFGVDKWDYPIVRTNEAKCLIKRFNAVSVREKSSALLCKEFLGVDAEVVLDPTLLLEASEYLKFCADLSPISTPYIAAYILDDNEEKEAFIQAVAEERGLRVNKMTVSDEGNSIEEWLSTIKNAEYVITDSYHGCLFSLLFEKQFKLFVNKERGADRFYTLAESLGIEYDGVIDYKKVIDRLNVYREQSFRFISENLK